MPVREYWSRASAVGNFFGLMPEALMPKASRTGVELDSITARIAKQLYPDSVIFEDRVRGRAIPRQFLRRGHRQCAVRQLRRP